MPTPEEQIIAAEYLRRDLHQVINRYNEVTAYEVIGALDAVKMDMWDRLERHHQESEEDRG